MVENTETTEMSPEDFWAKVNWEGGLAETILDYGLEVPEPAREAAEAFKKAYNELVEALESWGGPVDEITGMPIGVSQR